MNDTEIVKALECCAQIQRRCAVCSAWNELNLCGSVVKSQALDLINRQKAEIADHKATEKMCAEVIARQGKEIAEQEAEIDRLNYILQCYALEYGTVGDKERLLKVARDEAVTEFVEGLKGELQTGAVVMRISVLNIIDDLVKKSRRAK